ncbi:MAG: GntG family PLP-dependent aldolase [Melioribacteraceae bacterium]|nr:GntG family PLP-dependent aldolase [Melioribacteraceae bacterium]
MIDLRSDTVTKPSEEMRKAMYSAEVGDDVYKEDPTVNELEARIAELLGKEAALFVPSGVMANQICLNVLTQPSDEVICESDSHIFQYESGSPAALSGIQLYPVKGSSGILDPQSVEEVIRPKSAYYMPRTKVLEVENTHNRAGGIVYTIEQIKDLKHIVDNYELKFHLDGARLWNAHIASGINLEEYCSFFDTVSVCLSKGLGAPVGSVIAGAKNLVEEAYRVRKGWGGGMRQVGIIAAAGLYAIENNIQRLKEDHELAKTLADYLHASDNFEIDIENVQTNILIFKPKFISVEEVLQKCQSRGLLLSVGKPGTLRAVTHMDVNNKDINQACKILDELFN